MADYNSAYTGSEIDQGVGNGLAAPTTYAPIAHDSSATTYGKGTDTNYGHLKLSDSTSSTSSTSGGIAATPAAVKSAYDLASSKQSVLTFDNSPTANSNNPVKSGGVYSALASKADSSDIPSAYTSNPAMDGTASPGTSTYWARGNHVHPTDTSRASQTALDTYPRPNLLTNTNFLDPVNSRGQSSYSGSKYAIDAWRMWNANMSMSITSTGLTLTNSDSANKQQFVQYLSEKDTLLLTGKQATLSCMVNGVLYTCTGNLGSLSSVSIPNGTLQLNTGNGGLIAAQIYANQSSSITKLQAVKLELGPTQTLARNTGTSENPVWVINEWPNKAEEILRASIGEQMLAADVGTGLALYRQEAFFSADTNPTINGAINWTYS